MTINYNFPGVRGTFLNYENILHKIPNQWKNTINENRVFIYQNRYIITCNVFVAYLFKDKKDVEDSMTY